ncbi:hypothetical protein JW887_05550 [Candidatus Dojkabacteria bacterium]|nr:hypothetical protein [Candidatus Dojkabacteria bacterium]
MIGVEEKKIYYSTDEEISIDFSGSASCVVSKGDEISPDSLIFEGESSEVLQSINLPKDLGVNVDEVGKYLLKDQGEIIDKGEVIARRSVSFGLAEKIAFSQYNGKVALDRLSSGFVDIMAPSEYSSVKAGIYGKVFNILPLSNYRRSISFSVNGFVAKAFTCVGESKGGKLKLIKDGNSMYSTSDIDESCKGKILVLGRKLTFKLYEAAVENDVSGIIVGAVDRAEFDGIKDEVIPIFVTEGWGTIPINAVLLDLLSSHKDKFTYLDVDRESIVLYHDDRENIKKRSFFVNIPDFNNVDICPVRLVKIGDFVKILDLPFWGYTAKVISIMDNEDLIQVILDSGRKVLLSENSFVLI